MYGLFPYFISKNWAELPVVLLNPMLLTIITYFAFDFELSVEQFFLYYFCLLLLTMCAQSFGYMISSIFENGDNCLAIAPLFVMPMILFGGLMVNNDK